LPLRIGTEDQRRGGDPRSPPRRSRCAVRTCRADTERPSSGLTSRRAARSDPQSLSDRVGIRVDAAAARAARAAQLLAGVALDGTSIYLVTLSFTPR